MAITMFLEFPNPATASANVGPLKVVGESLDAAHPNTIELSELTFGIENPTTIGSASGGAGAGKAQFHALQIKKNVDSASATLFSALGVGAHFPDATIYVRKAGGPQTDYLVYKLKMVFVTKLDWSESSGDQAPTESVEFVFGALQLTYTAQQPNGQAGKSNNAIWNQVTNQPSLNMPTP